MCYLCIAGNIESASYAVIRTMSQDFEEGNFQIAYHSNHKVPAPLPPSSHYYSTPIPRSNAGSAHPPFPLGDERLSPNMSSSVADSETPKASVVVSSFQSDHNHGFQAYEVPATTTLGTDVVVKQEASGGSSLERVSLYIWSLECKLPFANQIHESVCNL